MNTRHDDFHDGITGTFTVFGIVIGKLDGIHVRCDDHSTVGLLEAVKLWQVIQCEVQFGNIAIASQASNTIREANLEILYPEQLEERRLGIRSGDDALGFDRLTVSETHAFDRQSIGTAVDQDSLDLGAAPDIGPEFCGRCGQRLDHAIDSTAWNRVSSRGFSGHAIEQREYRAVW